MNRHEAVLAASLGILLIVAGMTWRFGAYGLIGCGVAVLTLASLADIKQGKDGDGG